MEQMILSLKNLYNILKKYDFPVYSGSVIGKFEKKGMTMQGFWQRQMIEEFRCETYGRMIWRNDGKRNRYTSHLCNRSEELKCYAQYARELAAHISRETMLKQIHSFEEFFMEKEYNHDMFLYRVQELMRLCEAQDSCICFEIVKHVKEVLNGYNGFQKYGNKEKLFQASYLMTILMLYASAGKSMYVPELAVLRGKEYSMEMLWKEYKNQAEEKESESEVEILTEHVPFLQDNCLPEWRFFGREEAVYDLKEIAVRGQKCLINGMGGIGKTELLRQLIRLCQKQKLVDKLAIVACEYNFENSILRSFSRYHGGTEFEYNERYQQVVQRIRWDAEHGKVLILLDNYISNKENDEKLRQLLALPCALLVTARQAELEGLENYRLPLPDVSTGSLIFRDNYEKHLNRNDRIVLEAFLADEAICHPLTIRLIARAARSRGWTVEELMEEMKKKHSEVSWKEGDSMVRLSRFYRQLYSFVKIQKDCREVAELFSVLPRDSYSKEFLRKWFPQICCGEELTEKIAVLTHGGWLDADDKGSSMHPLIAECLRKKMLTEGQMKPMLGYVCDVMIKNGYRYDSKAEEMELQKITRILLHISGYLTGAVSKKLLFAILISIGVAGSAKRAERVSPIVLKKILKNCAEKDEEIEIAAQIALCQMRMADSETLVKLFDKQQEKRTVPEWMFSVFCMYSGMVLFLDKNSRTTEMFEYAMQCDLHPVWKAEGYYWLSTQYEYTGNGEAALKCAEEGVAFIRQHFDLTKESYIQMLGRACTMYIAYRKQEEAERILTEMKEYFVANEDALEKFNFVSVQALYELNFGNLETALSYYKESLDLIEPYIGMERTHHMIRGQIATILLRLKRYEAAVEAYKTLLVYAEKESDEFMLHLFQNNISVAYLELRQPEYALEHLQVAYRYAETLGGYSLGEVSRNLARAYRQTGDEQNEYEWVKKASWLLESSYGPEHPRSVEMRERLVELERK